MLLLLLLSILFNKALRKYIYNIYLYVSYSWPNGWTKWANISGGRQAMSHHYFPFQDTY